MSGIGMAWRHSECRLCADLLKQAIARVDLFPLLALALAGRFWTHLEAANTMLP
jgi:hypothetical protein